MAFDFDRVMTRRRLKRQVHTAVIFAIGVGVVVAIAIILVAVVGTTGVARWVKGRIETPPRPAPTVDSVPRPQPHLGFNRGRVPRSGPVTFDKVLADLQAELDGVYAADFRQLSEEIAVLNDAEQSSILSVLDRSDEYRYSLLGVPQDDENRLVPHLLRKLAYLKHIRCLTRNGTFIACAQIACDRDPGLRTTDKMLMILELYSVSIRQDAAQGDLLLQTLRRSRNELTPEDRARIVQFAGKGAVPRD